MNQLRVPPCSKSTEYHSTTFWKSRNEWHRCLQSPQQAFITIKMPCELVTNWRAISLRCCHQFSDDHPKRHVDWMGAVSLELLGEGRRVNYQNQKRNALNQRHFWSCRFPCKNFLQSWQRARLYSNLMAMKMQYWTTILSVPSNCSFIVLEIF